MPQLPGDVSVRHVRSQPDLFDAEVIDLAERRIARRRTAILATPEAALLLQRGILPPWASKTGPNDGKDGAA